MNCSSNSARYHTIRLHGPWKVQLLTGDEPVTGGKLQLPDQLNQWLVDANANHFRLVRPFNCPTGLAPDQRVWLSIQAAKLPGQVYLNEALVGDLDEHGCHEEIQQHLKPRNQLQIDCRVAKHHQSMSIQGVRLEIEQ